MHRVQLAENILNKDEMALIPSFIRAANEQGFDIDWVESVLTAAIADNYSNFLSIMLAHIEIIPELPTSSSNT